MDDQALLTNTPAQAKSLLHNLKQAARCIGLYVNSDKTELMCFKKDSAISLNGKPVKSIDQFIYIGNNISSTESDVNILIGKHELLLICYRPYPIYQPLRSGRI